MSLTKKELDSLRAALESKRADLMRAHANNVATGTHSDEGNLSDAMDAATRSEEQAERLGLAHQERELLIAIERALAKMSDGTYGVSELSGAEIPIARLRAIPWARLTVEEEEQRGRG